MLFNIQENVNKMAVTMEESMRDLDPEGAIGENDIDDAAHDKLINSIYALDGKKRWANAVRGAGLSSNNVDLLVHTKKESTKLKATDLSLKVKKAKMVDKPLSTLETEKAKRHIARGVMEKDTKKWEPIIQEIRAAPQIKYAERPKGVEMYNAMQPQKFSPRTPLEIELYEALGKSEDIIKPDESLTDAEKKALKAMSFEEAMARRKELLLHHNLLNRMQVKAKRIKKIKSKRYRRGLRKDKEAKAKRHMEHLKETDPEAFLAKMEELDKARIEERLTLKHKNGGKFARYHKSFSKYDEGTREAVQEMIRKGKELTQKQHIESSSDEEEEVEMIDSGLSASSVRNKETNNEADKMVSDLNSKHLEMMKSISKKAGGWLDSTTKYVLRDETETELATSKNVHDDDDSDIGEENLTGEPQKASNKSPTKSDISLSEEASTKTIRSKKRKRKNSQVDENNEENQAHSDTGDNSPIKKSIERKTPAKKQKVMGKDEGGDGIRSPKKKGIDKNIDNKNAEGNIMLVESTVKETPAKKQRVMEEDVDEDESKEKSKSSKKKEKQNKVEKKDEKKESAKKTTAKDKIKEITLKPTELELEKTDAEREDENDDDSDSGEAKAVTMEELFEDEDVVEQFERDKEEEEEKRRPKKESTVLPGWGSWSGPDFKEKEKERESRSNKPKRRRKFQPKLPNKEVDKHPNLWLNPKRNNAIRELQPKKVPFPYVSADQFASSIRQPVSRGFVREISHKILVKPEVVTKLGHIIKPLDKDDFFKKNDSLDVDNDFGKKGKEIKYMGPINFRNRDERLKTC